MLHIGSGEVGLADGVGLLVLWLALDRVGDGRTGHDWPRLPDLAMTVRSLARRAAIAGQ